MAVTNPLVRILVKALRDAGNENGKPIPSYYDSELQFKFAELRAARVHEIIAAGLAECPLDALEEGPRDKESKFNLNSALNAAAGGYRLTGICEGCKGTGFTMPNYDPCIVVGCISRTDERVKVLVSEGKPIEAIRLHRSLHNVGLLEAKRFIDNLRGFSWTYRQS